MVAITAVTLQGARFEEADGWNKANLLLSFDIDQHRHPHHDCHCRYVSAALPLLINASLGSGAVDLGASVPARGGTACASIEGDGKPPPQILLLRSGSRLTTTPIARRIASYTGR
jgi:hypothetical protein